LLQLGIAYVIVTTILFLFPPDLPVDGSNMNYCIVAFFIVIMVSIVQWFVDGRHNYKGPRVELVGDPVSHKPGTAFEYRGEKPMAEANADGIGEMEGNGTTAELSGNNAPVELNPVKDPAELNG